MQKQDNTRVKVIRRAPYHFGPGPAQPTLVESCSDRFDMEIRPDAVDPQMQRLEFNWRAPAQNLLASSKLYIEFDVLIQSTRDISQISQASSGISVQPNGAQGGGDNFAGVSHTHRAIKPAALLAFGAGDPILAGCESASLVVNGSSLTTPSPTLWSRPFMRANLKSEDAQRIYSQSGGKYDAYDGQAAKTFSLGCEAGGAATKGYGFSLGVDSGITTRARNLYNQIYKVVEAAGVYKGITADARGIRVCRVRWPVSAGSLLNPWIGSDLPRYSPCAGAPYGIANLNSCQLSLIFRKNILQTLIRDYGQPALTTNPEVKRGGAAQINGTQTELSIDTGSVRLMCRYYRLAPQRQVPVSFACKIWRPMVSLADAMPKAVDVDAAYLVEASGIKQLASANADTVFSDAARTYLMPSGRDSTSKPAIDDENPPDQALQIQLASHDKFWEVTWSNLSFPMLPDQLLICAPKDSFCFDHKLQTCEGTVKGRSVTNRDSSLAIKQLEISVNTTERTYKFSRDTDSCFRDQQIMLEDTLQNVQKGFFGGDFDAFRTRNHFVLLSSDQFCPIAQMSCGVTSPVQITVTARFRNECVYTDGLCAVSNYDAGTGVVTAGDNAVPYPVLSCDLIRSRPVVVAFFQRSTLQINPSSAVVSVQSYSQSSAAEILASNV